MNNTSKNSKNNNNSKIDKKLYLLFILDKGISGMPVKRNKVAPTTEKFAIKPAEIAKKPVEIAKEAAANSSGTPLTQDRKYNITDNSQKTAKATAEAVAEEIEEEIEEDLRQREYSHDDCYHNGYKKPCLGKCTKCRTCHACKVAAPKLMCDFHLNQK